VVLRGKVPFDWDRLKGYVEKILPFAEKSRKKLSADQDTIKFLRRERSFYFPQRGFSNNLPFCERSRDGITGRFTPAVSMEGAGTRTSIGSMEAVNEAEIAAEYNCEGRERTARMRTIQYL